MRSNRPLRRGFALPAVLAVTGIVTIIFLVAMTALQNLNDEALSARSRVQFTQKALTAEAMVTYLVATEPTSTRSISIGAARKSDDLFGITETTGNLRTSGQVPSEIQLDGRTYVFASERPLVLSLRDQAGMINLANLQSNQIEALADRLGASSSVSRTIWALYNDYVDTDSLRQPGGAESADYAAAGLPGPANRPLVRVDEWLSILGLRDELDSRSWRALRQDLAADSSSRIFNLNTASQATLQVKFGLSSAQAAAAIRNREQAPFLSLEQFVASTGALVQQDPEQIYTFPSGRVILAIRDSNSPWVYRARLILTPSGRERPVWIDQTDMLEAPRRKAAETRDVPQFPYTPR